MSRTRPLARLAFALACAGSTGACAAVFGFERLSVDDADAAAVPVESGAEASLPDGAVPADPCHELGLPPHPVLDGGATADAGEPIHLALKLFDFGINTGASGLNLDRTCSATVATSSCKTAATEAAFASYARDLDDKGLDNASYGLLRYLAYLGEAFRPDKVNERLGQGSFGFVFRVLDWNGQPDDDDVSLEVFPTVGVVADPSAPKPAPGGTPAFLSSDRWLRDDRFRKAPGVDASLLRSTSGYVTRGRLVAAFDRVTVPISVPDDPKALDIIIREGFVLGTLTKDGSGWRLADGVLAGRWSTADLLGQVREIHIADTLGLRNVDLCDPGSPTAIYNLVKTEGCKGRDLRSASVEDNRGLSCDAISTGIRFDSYALDAAGAFLPRPAVTPTRCQQDGSVPLGDDCAPAP
ncbi:MAG: hypothetical protein JWP97_6416 [Labilithrix sp.]|nr:hypothetical protein [Labilithrix sp.]